MAGWGLCQKDALRLHGKINLQNVFITAAGNKINDDQQPWVNQYLHAISVQMYHGGVNQDTNSDTVVSIIRLSKYAYYIYQLMLVCSLNNTSNV
jgi:hypothetical protein